jgi:hypothetical protein
VTVQDGDGVARLDVDITHGNDEQLTITASVGGVSRTTPVQDGRALLELRVRPRSPCGGRTPTKTSRCTTSRWNCGPPRLRWTAGSAASGSAPSRHLRNAFQKLGVTSRRQLPARLAELSEA